jgi:hypothetical protein
LLEHLREAHSKDITPDSNGPDIAKSATGRTKACGAHGLPRQYYCAEGDSSAEVLTGLAYNVETGNEEWVKVAGFPRS